MSDAAAAERTETARSLLRGVLVVLVLATPLPLGAVLPWAVLSLELAAVCCGALAILVGLGQPLPRPARLAAVLTTVLMLIALLQLAPLPAAWADAVAPTTAAARARLADLVPRAAPLLAPVSLSAPATVDALLRFTAYALIAFSTVIAAREQRHRRQLALAVVLAGAFQGAYGAAEYLSGNQQIFGYAKRFYLDSATGTFINRNHYAGYLVLTLPLAFGLMLDAWRRSRLPRAWRERLLRLAESPGSLVLAAGAAAGLIWLGVLLSRSRGGLATALLASGLVAFASARRTRAVTVLVLVLAVPTGWLLWQDVRPPGDRFVLHPANAIGLEARLPVWGATLRMVPDFLPLGSGFGTFGAGLEQYRPAAVDMPWPHAHNDWLQTLTEGGPIAFLALVTLLIVVLSTAWRAPPDSRPLVPCVGAAVAAGAVHAIVDFGPRIPALAVLLAVLVGLVCSVDPDRRRDLPVPQRRG